MGLCDEASRDYSADCLYGDRICTLHCEFTGVRGRQWGLGTKSMAYVCWDVCVGIVVLELLKVRICATSPANIEYCQNRTACSSIPSDPISIPV